MLKIIMGNKGIKNSKNDIIMYPEIKVGLDKIEEYLRKKAESNKTYTVYSLNNIVYLIGVLLYLQEKNVEVYIMNKGKKTKIVFDDLGYVINNTVNIESYFKEHKIMNKINNIRLENL